jgi:hypothetical protein
MILAAGSGCDGCSGGSNYNPSVEEIDTIPADDNVPETPQREEYEEKFFSDIEEEEREEEEVYQSETEDEHFEDEHDEDDNVKLDSIQTL